MPLVTDERAAELASLRGLSSLPWKISESKFYDDGWKIDQWDRDMDELSVAAVNALPDLLADRAAANARIAELEEELRKLKGTLEEVRWG